MTSTYSVVPRDEHDALVRAAFEHRGFTADEASDAARLSAMAAEHGIRTHNAIKALHLDELFGSGAGGCVPRAELRELPSRFRATRVWDAQRKLGQSVAYRAMQTCMDLADEHGVGVVSVDNAFHYLWGGGYVLDAAARGYIAYTACTSALAEVVPFRGVAPTLGTNPHSWAFPTTELVGFPVLVDWATSTVAMGRVQQLAREGRPLPRDAAVDANGQPTTDPAAVSALVPFGGHKGYGLALIDELYAAYIGGSLPTVRGRAVEDGEKNTASFYFQCIHPEAMAGTAFARGRTQADNVGAVLRDVLGHGNESCMLPGQPEAIASERSREHGGLLFSSAELDAFAEIARECGRQPWSREMFPRVEVE